jgi:hypothetical protein
MVNSIVETKKSLQEPFNYFYFSGQCSGIKVNTKNSQNWPFTKGFGAAIWFCLEDRTCISEDKLSVLFNCFSQQYGGFECYFVERKLFYRIIPRVYTPPTVNSNGVLIGEFEPRKWYFLGIEHDKPFISRA